MRAMRLPGLIAILMSMGCSGALSENESPDGGTPPGSADAAPDTPDARPGAPDARAPLPDAGGDPAMVAKCSAEIEYVNTSARDGQLFEDRVPDVTAFFHAKSLQVCQV